MTRGPGVAVPWWTVPPACQVTYVVCADPELLSISLDPLPSSAPAVVQFRPGRGGRLGDQVALLLDGLDRAAIALFPSWLPGADRLSGPHGLGVAAVRALAAEKAARSRSFGPFLADLAARALGDGTGDRPALDRPAGGRSRFPAEVRAAGLARVIADAYGRESTALLVTVPDGLSPVDESTLTAAAEWLTSHGRVTVWLAGAPLCSVDRIRCVPIRLPSYLTELAGEAATVGGEATGEASGGAPGEASGGADGKATGEPNGEATGEAGDGVFAEPLFTYPPLSGQPRPDSAAEQALERALARYEWAQGRRWNHTYEWHLLAKAYRLDLFWPADGLVVEVDGPEHRGVLKFADDRRRDVQLQLIGYDVLRFTNEHVLRDVQSVVLKIKQSLSQRRAVARAS